MSKLIIDAAKDNIFLMIITNNTIYSVTHENSKTNFDKLIILLSDFLKKNNLSFNDFESMYINRSRKFCRNSKFFIYNQSYSYD